MSTPIKYQWIEYEVWGNSKDGYEVNNAHTTSVTIELSAHATYRDILHALKFEGIIKKGIHLKSIEFQDDGSVATDAYHSIPVYSVKDGYPLGELRKVS